MTSALDVFFAGDINLRKAHEAAEVDKLGILRGGSAGCLLDDNTTIGCAHEALARYMGYSIDKSLSQGYFDAGVDNEQIWERNIQAALPHMGYDFYKTESDIPVRYMLDGKHLITGRPDLVLGVGEGDDFLPLRGVELKACQSLDVGSDRLFGLKPDPKHLCQAGFYMHAMGIPWSLVYSINVTGDTSYFRRKDYGEAKLPLGKVEFLLEIRDGRIHYQHPETSTWVPTVVTIEGILNYYRLVVDMKETKQVGVTQLARVTALGDEAPFDYNLYNDFTNMVPVNQGWDTFIEYCEKLKGTKRYIKFSKGKYQVCEAPEMKGPKYVAQPVIVVKTTTLKEARKVAYAKD